MSKLSRQVLAVVALFALTMPLVSSCDKPAGGVQTPSDSIADVAKGCDELKSGDFSSLKLDGDAKVQGQVKGFLHATYELNNTASEVESSLIAACTQLGKEIGVNEDELKGDAGGGKGAEKVCSAVVAKIESTLKAKAEAKLQAEVTPPTCEVPVDAATTCFEGCGVAIKAAQVEASCKGGELVGKCEGECKGTCLVEAGAACAGSCGATCSGACKAQFSGTCGGKCKGKCDGKKSKGKCAGNCEGSCDAQASGNCGGTCSGTCSSTCEIKGKAKCEGTCSGGCSVALKEPACTGSFEPPALDAGCQLECASKLQAKIKCNDPTVHIESSGKIDDELIKLVAALRTSLPKIVKLQLGLGKRAVAVAEGLVQAGAEVASSATQAGTQAAACIAQAIVVAGEASASLNVSVKASARVSGSVSGTAG